MICKNCNTENPPENTVCSSCGCSLIHKKKKNSLHKYAGLVAVFVFAAITFIVNTGIFTKKYEYSQNRTSHPIVYIKNNTLGVKPVKKSSNILSDYLLANPASMDSPKVFESENGEGIYFLEGFDNETLTGALFASYNGKTKIPVSSKVYSNVQISPDGKYALFIDLPSINEKSGTLFMYKKNSEKEKIADNVQLDGFAFSKNSKEIVYITQGDLYFQSIGSQREKIDSDVTGIANVSAFSSVIYTKSNTDYGFDLYYWCKNKEAVKIGERVSSNLIFTSPISDSFYFCGDSSSSTNANLYYKHKKKEPVLIDTNVLSPLVWDCNYNNIIYTKNFSIDNYTLDTYLKLKNKDAVKISAKAGVEASYDFKSIVYLSDIDETTGLGNLYMKKNSLLKDEEPMLISGNVYSFEFSKDGKVLLYVEAVNGNTSYSLHLFKDNKDSVIAENVHSDHFELTANNKAVFYLSNYNSDKNSGNLFSKSLSNLKSESIKIDTDVTKNFYVRSDKQIIYTKNYSTETGESELYLWKGKKSECIDKGTISVLFEK